MLDDVTGAGYLAEFSGHGSARQEAAPVPRRHSIPGSPQEEDGRVHFGDTLLGGVGHHDGELGQVPPGPAPEIVGKDQQVGARAFEEKAVHGQVEGLARHSTAPGIDHGSHQHQLREPAGLLPGGFHGQLRAHGVADQDARTHACLVRAARRKPA